MAQIVKEPAWLQFGHRKVEQSEPADYREKLEVVDWGTGLLFTKLKFNRNHDLSDIPQRLCITKVQNTPSELK